MSRSDLLTLVDLSSIYWQAWHSQQPGDLPTAPHDTTIRRVRQIDGHVAICCDSPTSWRRERYSLYKANREARPAEALAQYRATIDTLRRDGYVMWEADGMEADDVIAAAVARHDGPCVIVTADKDLMQLVSDRVSIRSTRDGSMIGPDEVMAKFGVRPSQIADYLALVGDTSDNVPGVPGIGAKTASAMLSACGDLFRVLDMARDAESSMKPSNRAALLENETMLGVARVLTGLRTDIEIDVSDAFRPRRQEPLPAASDGVLDEPEDAAPVVVEAPARAPAAPIVRVNGDEWALALEPNDAESAWKLAKVLFNSRLFSGFASVEALFSVVLLGRTLGVPAVTIARSVHIVEGKPTLSAQFMVGLVLKSGRADYMKCSERSATRATWITHRRDDPDPAPTAVTWTIEDAERAGRRGGNWTRYPAQMLSHRAASDLARMVYPDVVGGLYTPDEMEET